MGWGLILVVSVRGRTGSLRGNRVVKRVFLRSVRWSLVGDRVWSPKNFREPLFLISREWGLVTGDDVGHICVRHGVEMVDLGSVFVLAKAPA